MKQLTPDDWRQYVKKQMVQAMGQAIAVVICLAICLIISMCMSGCKTASSASYRQVKADTIYIYKSAETKRASMVKDSIHIKDSIYTSLLTHNDTIYITTDRWHTRYKTLLTHDTLCHWRTDTVYKARTDTATASKTAGQIKKGWSGLSSMQRFVYGVGVFSTSMFLLLLIFGVGAWLLYKYRTWRGGNLQAS
jgi:K+-sensing histidine kinase KdpD